MALIVDGATVATGMSPVVEGALYADAIFIDGMTFTSKYQIGEAGQIQVVVDQRTAGALEPKTPGADFEDENYKNKVINININNSFKKSVKVPSYCVATMPVNVLANQTWSVTEQVREGRQATALAVLANGGTIKEDTTVIDAANVKGELIASRKTLRKKFAKPNVVLASVDTYSTILEAAGKDFTPLFNDDVLRSGKVGTWLGMIIIECPLLDNTSSYKYIDESGSPQTVDMSKVEYIMYDFNAFSIIDKLICLRPMDSEMFSGVKVQEDLVVGLAVTNKDCVLVKKKQG